MLMCLAQLKPAVGTEPRQRATDSRFCLCFRCFVCLAAIRTNTGTAALVRFLLCNSIKIFKIVPIRYHNFPPHNPEFTVDFLLISVPVLIIFSFYSYLLKNLCSTFPHFNYGTATMLTPILPYLFRIQNSKERYLLINIS